MFADKSSQPPFVKGGRGGFWLKGTKPYPPAGSLNSLPLDILMIVGRVQYSSRNGVLQANTGAA